MRIGATFRRKTAGRSVDPSDDRVAYQDLGLYPEARQQLERSLELRRTALGEHDPCDAGSAQRRRSFLQPGGQVPRGGAAVHESIGRSAARLRRGTRRRSCGHGRSLARVSISRTLCKSGGAHPTGSGHSTPCRGCRGSRNRRHHLEPRLLYLNQGKYRQAESQYREAVAGLRRLRGPDHPNTIAALNGLALTYRGLGKRAEAESDVSRGSRRAAPHTWPRASRHIDHDEQSGAPVYE